MTRDRSSIKNKISFLKQLSEKCVLCPRKCGVNRMKNEKGFCGAGMTAEVYSYSAHQGEEPPLSGYRGSGTIFFAHCNMKCVYCQNYVFSQDENGNEKNAEELAYIMLELQKAGCHNINLVSPTHYITQIAESILIARINGLVIPIVYNTGGYDSVEIIKIMDGLVDIYMPDMRYSDDSMSEKYSSAPDYVENNRLCVKEMHRQKGDLLEDYQGIARKGLIIRCLVLPGNISGTGDTLKFIKEEISAETFISLMSQYYPAYNAKNCEPLSRRVTNKEYGEAVSALRKLGLNNGWVQESPSGMDDSLGGHRIRRKK